MDGKWQTGKLTWIIYIINGINSSLIASESPKEENDKIKLEALHIIFDFLFLHNKRVWVTAVPFQTFYIFPLTLSPCAY